MLRSPNHQRQQREAQAGYVKQPRATDLAISDPAGHRRYLGRPTYFGPLDPNSLEGFFAARADLERAEKDGPAELEAALARYGLSTAEQWWHIEASFYQRHMISQPRPPRSRSASGTPAPELLTVTTPRYAPAIAQAIAEDDDEPPVPFEVFCEIAGAQAAWSGRGLDPALEASRHFLLELEELTAVELYWAAELAKSRELARQFARRMLDYKSRFSDG